MFTGVVLAGGKSIRMGTDKAGLGVKDLKADFLAHACNTLKACGASNIHISHNTGRGIVDKIPQKGPLSGVYTALNIEKRDLLIVPVDMPLLTPTMLRPLLHTSARASFINEQPLPFFVRYSLELEKLLLHLLQEKSGKQLSIKGFLHSIDSESITVDGFGSLRNINTPLEYTHYLRSADEG